MLEYITEILHEQNIFCFAPIKLSDCKIVNEHLLQRENIEKGTAIIMAVPYYTEHCDESRNISAYAVSRDYHLFYKNLFGTVVPKLQNKFKNNKFVGFTDHSPIAEVSAAAMAGIGIIGDNHMLITEKYSSYVFLGEIITDAIIDCETQQIQGCEHCGACMSHCPYYNKECAECLSAITQKKGELTDDEKKLIVKYGYAWGCDICQEVCPHTLRAKRNGSIYSPIEFFKNEATPIISQKTIQSMTKEQFSLRAYSWRGIATLSRNLSLFENPEENHEQR